MCYYVCFLKDILSYCIEEGVTSVTEMPYFDGDYWPKVVEDTIKELNEKAKLRGASENDSDVCWCVYCYINLYFDSPFPSKWRFFAHNKLDTCVPERNFVKLGFLAIII